jgi:hypothetical protein
MFTVAAESSIMGGAGETTDMPREQAEEKANTSGGKLHNDHPVTQNITASCCVYNIYNSTT